MGQFQTAQSILLGRNFDLDSTLMIGVDGLLFAFPEVNDTDGLWAGYETLLAYKPQQGQALQLRANTYYTTKRRKMVWHSYLSWHYAPKRDALLLVGVGQSSGEYNLLNGHQSYLSDYVEPALGNEPIRLYTRNWALLRHEVELTPFLGLDLTATYERRSPISTAALCGPHRALNSEVRLRIHPLSKIQYSTAGGAHYIHPLGMLIPEINLGYRRAYPLGGDIPSADYHRIDLVLRGALPIGSKSYLQYVAGYGRYLTKTWRSEQDLKYIANNSTISFKHLSDRFQTISFPKPLGDEYGTLYLNFFTQALPLSRAIYKASRLSVDEAFHLRVLVSDKEWSFPLFDSDRNHEAKGRLSVQQVEIGYSMGAGDLFRIGAFWGFGSGKYDSFVLRIALPIFQLSRFWSERD